MRLLLLLSSLLLLLLMSACSMTYNYEPDTDTYKFPPVANFTSENEIYVVNTSQSTEPFLYGTAGVGGAAKWMGNLKEWTDVAVEITNRELSNHGMKIAPDASKKIELSILEARASTGGWGFRGNVTLKASTGAGYEHVYQGESPSPDIVRTADGAIMQAVAAMLRDEKIVSYLTE